jgi:HSP20 family protein
MSLIKFNKRRVPRLGNSVFDLMNRDDFFNAPFWNGDLEEPAMNVKETKTGFEVELAAPGFSKKDFEVSVDDGCLNVSAEKSSSTEDKEEDYTRQEFSYSSFQKSISLPENVENEKVKATYKDGILKLDLLKKKDTKQKAKKVIDVG